MVEHGRIETLLGSPVRASEPATGGCLFDVRRVVLADGRVVAVKTGQSDVGDHLRLEARMLADLRRAGAPIPAVVAVADDVLVLDWVAHDRRPLSTDGQERFAAELAALHAHHADAPGYAYDTVIGRLAQPNPWTSSWIAFYRDQRLLAQSRAAVAAGRLEPELARVLERLAADLDRWLVEPARPSLLHGDLWQGNLLTRGGLPVAWIDPAIYFGDAEIELAFGTLFGPVDAAVLDAYAEHRPIAPGFLPTRRAIYTLYPLLVHRRLFGSSYARPIAEILASLGYRP